jgi:TolB-like protein
MPKAVTADRLDSWKEIAAYLGRDVRTVQRWAKNEALPIHRKLHKKKSSVYAFKRELDQWWDDGRLFPDGVTPAGTPSPHRQLLAVLPLRNQTGLPDQEYFSDGLTEELIAQLSRVNPAQLGVIAGGSIMVFKHTTKNINQIGRELGAAYVLDGNVRRSDDRVRIAVNLINADDQGIVWSQSYDRSLSNILELQNEVARSVTSRIAVTLTTQEQSRLDRSSLVPPGAYEAYLRGRGFWNRRREEDLRAAVRLFQQAIDEDLNYAPAHAGLADCYALLSSVTLGAMMPSKTMPKAKAAAQRALRIDPELADAHASLAYVHAFFDWDWSAAEREFARALELNPSYATARQWYSEYMIIAGRIDDAIVEIKRAREYDPLSMAIPAAHAAAMYFARQYDDTIAECRTTLALEPNSILAYLNLGRAWMMKREYRKAIAELRTAADLTGGNSTLILAVLGHAHGLARSSSEARGILSQLSAIARHKYVPAFNFATVYAGLGDHDGVFRWLRKARVERCEYLSVLPREPAAEAIRSDPRFVKVVPVPP